MEMIGATITVRFACQTCDRRSYRAGGALRCLDWKRHTTIMRCARYVGPHPECHFKVYGGPEYADSLAHAGIKR
jgi:hypothetical protein